MDLNKEIKVVLSYEKTKSSWKNDHSSKEWKLANRISGVVMGEPLQRKPNCGCLDELFIMLKTMKIEKIKQKQNQMDSNFKLKDGIVIQLHGVDILTNDNLTDEKAINLLKKYPSHSASFAEKPSDWRELVAKGVAPAPANKVVHRNPNTGGAVTREDILLGTDITVLRKLADDIADKKKIRKAMTACKEKGLTNYILKNE